MQPSLRDYTVIANDTPLHGANFNDSSNIAQSFFPISLCHPLYGTSEKAVIVLLGLDKYTVHATRPKERERAISTTLPGDSIRMELNSAAPAEE